MSFEFRKEYLEALSLFDDKVMRLALYDTICNFGINGEDTDLAGYELTQYRIHGSRAALQFGKQADVKV